MKAQNFSAKGLMKGILIFFVLLTSHCTYAQKPVTGLVIDASDQQPMPGVSITVAGTKTAQITDVNGQFSITLPTEKATLRFAVVGYNPKEMTVKAGENIVVKMDASLTTLDEVVIQSQPLMGRLAGVSVKRSRHEAKMMKAQSCIAPQAYYAAEKEDESYTKIHENGFKSVKTDALSTFSIDVDKASYANMRRFINQGQTPPQDAVRVEELINYFEYDYPQPTGNDPFTINTELTTCPWQEGHQLLRIGIQGKKIATDNLPASNLVFLLDVSGSMQDNNKLPLVKQAFRLLVNNLRDKDHVAIVVYAGAAGMVLPSTSGSEKAKILAALDGLSAGGSTAGCEGIALAYKTAAENFVKEGNNRVILATDGDFNVGMSNENELENFITDKRKSGIYLTCLGFGMGNYKDSKMEVLADKGNGNYAYIDDIVEANKVFVNEFGGTLFTIAKDVKAQIEFNPGLVQSYRLVGYENRLLNNEDFKDDTKDAGELGSGHTVTALYEIIPTGADSKYNPAVDPLKYQAVKTEPITNYGNEVATIKFRYKKPDAEKSIEMVHPIANQNLVFAQASENTRFAASVAMLGMMLTNSQYKGTSNYENTIANAENARGKDKDGYRAEFIRLAKTASNLKLSANVE